MKLLRSDGAPTLNAIAAIEDMYRLVGAAARNAVSHLARSGVGHRHRTATLLASYAESIVSKS